MTTRACRACGGSGKINRYKVVDGETIKVEEDCRVCKKAGEVLDEDSIEEKEVVNTTKWILVLILIFLILFVASRVLEMLA